MKGQEPQPPQRVHTATTASHTHFSSPSGQRQGQDLQNVSFLPTATFLAKRHLSSGLLKLWFP